MGTVTRPSKSLPDPGDSLDAEPIRDYINNILTFIEGQNADAANVDYTSADGIMVLNAAQTTVNALKTVKITTAVAAGVQDVLVFEWDPSNTPTVDNQGLGFSFKMTDDANNAVEEVATFETVMTDVSSTS